MAEETFDTTAAWLGSVFQEMFRAIHSHEQDNFDSYRYPEAYRHAFFSDQHARYLGFLVEHADSFHAARRLLQDPVSSDLFDRLILFRLLGHLHIRLPFNNPETMRRRKVPDEWKIDETGDIGMFGPLCIFSVPYRDSEIWVKCGAANVAATFLSGQYYFDRGGVQIRPRWLGLHVRSDAEALRDHARSVPNESATCIAHPALRCRFIEPGKRA